ncbi:DUF3991 domain-containing protein [Mesorhizobium microcysteis]|uniref:DUF3991 domain-containing protein n=1 Tax=Neoaquamicrobium microcysteis TaxID=2682781 RepID=A0A5D4H018_9HYPH|nr:DUF3991 and toprim domain-containing protein [Mesorhizobium microcysteis]TYR33429.1 DUF3991 domain-containing protein [Mesorhizobium microcysteis]
MERREIEELREKVSCEALLDDDGWAIDVKESTRGAVKYRRGEGEIIIVIHGGRGWFDPLSAEDKGDVFDLARRLGTASFAEALDRVGNLVGYVPAQKPHVQERPKASPASVEVRWGGRARPWPGSASWRYLSRQRAIPDAVITAAVRQGLLREGPYGSMWAAHMTATNLVVGWEERGPNWRGFATGGDKELFRLGPANPGRLCITEAAIDAMSLATFEDLRLDTAYVSTAGGWAPATQAAIRDYARIQGILLVAATDNNRQGDVYARRITAIGEELGCAHERLSPRGDDWNEDLRASLQAA